LMARVQDGETKRAQAGVLVRVLSGTLAIFDVPVRAIPRWLVNKQQAEPVWSAFIQRLKPRWFRLHARRRTVLKLVR